MAKKKGKKKAAKKARPKKVAPKAAYDVLINNGNDGGRALLDLDEVLDIADEYLLGRKDRELTLRITAKMTQGETGACRVDGVT